MNRIISIIIVTAVLMVSIAIIEVNTGSTYHINPTQSGENAIGFSIKAIRSIR